MLLANPRVEPGRVDQVYRSPTGHDPESEEDQGEQDRAATTLRPGGASSVVSSSSNRANASPTRPPTHRRRRSNRVSCCRNSAYAASPPRSTGRRASRSGTSPAPRRCTSWRCSQATWLAWKKPRLVVTREIRRRSQTPPEQRLQRQVRRVEHGGEGDQEPARRERGLGGDAYPEGCDEGWFALGQGLLPPSLLCEYRRATFRRNQRPRWRRSF